MDLQSLPIKKNKSMSTSIVPYGGNMPDLTNNQRSNLRIILNPGEQVNCGICNNTIKDDCVLCFCSECNKWLHPECAGVKIGTAYNTQDGSKHIMLPEQLPKSCRNCLRRKPIGNAITDLLMYDNQKNSVRTLATTSSITRYLEASNESAHKLIPCVNDDDYLIHTIVPGHELVQKDYGTVYSCFGCKEKGFGPHHACQSASCDFCLHEECKSPRVSVMHLFFPELSFFFTSSPPICKGCKKEHSTISCNGCGMDVNGYFYESVDEKNHLHPCCVNLPLQITCGDTGATMVLQKRTTSKCQYCGEKRVKINDKKTDATWSYVSKSENFHLHVQCIVKMLSDLNDESTRQRGGSRLELFKATTETGVMNMKLQIAAASNAKKKWEQKFKAFMKYAKIALGAIIAAFLGDPTTFVINLIVAFIS